MGEIARRSADQDSAGNLLKTASGIERGRSLMVCGMAQGVNNVTRPSARSGADRTADLVARIQVGDTAAFEELVAATQSRLLRLIRRLIDSTDDIEDVLQDVFVATFQGLPRFRQASSVTTWMTTITVNRCRTHRRRAARRRWLDGCLRSSVSDIAEHSSSDATDNAEEVRKAVSELSSKYREPVVLHYFEHMSVADIAGVLGLRTNTVEVRLSRARRLLRTALDGRIEGNDT